MSKKVIKLTEQDLEKIIKKVISEQNKYKLQPTPVTQDTFSSSGGMLTQQKQQQNAAQLSIKYPCVPLAFREAVRTLVDQGWNKYFLKTALGIIGRESDFGESQRYQFLNPLKKLGSYLGVTDTSSGFAQIKPETAKELGMSVEEINSARGALKAATRLIIQKYELVKNIGYTNEPSNVPNGTGNAKLDMAIAAYNAGNQKITKYCETNNPNLKKPCSLAGKVVDGLKVSNKEVKNYVPNFKTSRWDGVEISTHGYIQEVAKRLKGFYSCIPD